MRAASSKSLFVTLPEGLLAVNKEDCMESGKAWRHSVGGASGHMRSSQNPPMPCFEASVAAASCGGCGTMVCKGTGW